MGGFSAVFGSNHGGFQPGWGDSGGGGFTPASLGTQVQMWTLDGSSTRAVNGTIRLKDKSRSGTARQMQPGRSYLFAGVTDEVEAGASITTGAITALSCCAWIQIGLTATVRTIAGEWRTSGLQRSWVLQVNASEQLELSLSSDGSPGDVITSTVTLSTGSLVHVAATWNGSSVLFYVDGVVESAIATTAASLHDSTTVFAVGAHTTIGTPAEFFAGYIQDLRVFADVLTAVEVADIAAMTAGEAGVGANDPLVWYKCDEGGTVTIARDSSGNGNDGTIAAATPGDFHDEANNDKYSFQNEVGFTDDTLGATAAYLPRDESAPTLDVLAGALDFTGQAPRDPVLSSPCVTLDGVDDLITVGATGLSAIALDCRIKLLVDDQEIMSFQNLATHGVSVNASQTLEFGSSLTMSSVTIDGVSYTSDLVGAGALLNDRAWHRLIFIVSAISASNLVFGTDDSVAFGNIAFADIDVTSSSPSTICNLKCSEGIGGVAHDVGGFENHGVLTGVESEIWAAQQNLTDTMVTNGVRVATRLSSVNDHYPKGSRLTTGSLAKMSIACWIRTTAVVVAYQASEWTAAGDQRGWSLSTQTTGESRFSYTTGGTGAGAIINREGGTALNDGNWHHIAAVLDSDAGTLVMYTDGLLDNGTLTNTPNVPVFSGTAGFGINFLSAVGSAVEMLSGLVIEAGEAWSAATVAAIFASPAAVPGGAWKFSHGNGVDVNQGVSIVLNGAGVVERIPIPLGAGPPVNVGPQILQPGQSLDLGCGEANSPYAQQLLASALTNLTYNQGDDEDVAIQFARVLTTDDDGDDRIIVVLPALTAGDLTNMQTYTDE